MKGEVIGINSAIIASGQGIGFAIPSNLAKNIASQLREKGKVVRGWIGVTIQRVTPEIAQSFGLKESRGALVSDVVPEGPAQKAGMKRGDVIVTFNGKGIKNSTDLPRIVAETPVGKTVDVKIIRDKKEMVIKITIEEMTEKRMAESRIHPVSDLGMRIENITPALRNELGIKDRSGVVVTNVVPGSAADDAGIQPGDVIKEVNHHQIRNLNEYDSATGRTEESKPLLFLIKRGSQTFYISIKVG